MTRMHRIEDAARLAMGDFRAGDAPAVPSAPALGPWLSSIAVVAVCLASAVLAFGFY
ncbi:MAG: hypothetical protein Q8Q62_16570 [Mesorhizobium sp.]|nr:hypothetical protein [Mesorhizobium sp.]